MSKPAARMGDMTVHGGNIVVGCPTVLIGNMPAARMGDNHVCPMQTPAPVPVPHVGGPIAVSSAPTVLIGGMPAACVGDMVTCVGPPDTIAPPGCPTVLIGAGGGGGGGGGRVGAAGALVAGVLGGDAGESTGLEGGSGAEDEAEDETENHYLDVRFTDAGGRPITGVAYTVSDPGNRSDRGGLYGGLMRTGVEPGDHDIELKAITKVEWSKQEARVGDVIKLLADTAGIESGEEAKFEILQQDINQPPQRIKAIDGVEVRGDKVEAEWTYEYEDHPDDAPSQPTRGLSSPQYFFTVEVDGCEARSPMLLYRDWIEIKLNDDEGNPVANEEYVLRLSNGTIRQGTLDANGYKKEENVPPGEFQVEFPNLSHVGADDEDEETDRV